MSTERPAPFKHLVVPFGCKVSRIEACSIARNLESEGGRAADPDETADLIVVHGCTVTGRAERDARKEIRRLRREHPAARIVVSGCLARHAPSGLPGFRGADALEPERGTEWALDSPEIEPGRTRAFLKIQDGCSRRCAYCVLPAIRGPERSASPRSVLDAIRRLGDAGIPEVVLSGIHLAAWGATPRGLLPLLEDLETSPPACRVRISSLEPMEAGEELIDLVGSSRVVVPHLHLPLQSGSDGVLRRMRRGMTRGRFERLLSLAVSRNGRMHVGTDLIAGFPGETDREFRETLELVASLPLASFHVFPFSPRPGTEADALHRTRGVPPGVRDERAALLRAVGLEKRRQFALRQEGTRADVVSLRGGRGLTDHYLVVSLGRPGGSPPPGARFAALLETGPGPDRLRALPISPGSPASC